MNEDDKKLNKEMKMKEKNEKKDVVKQKEPKSSFKRTLFAELYKDFKGTSLQLHICSRVEDLPEDEFGDAVRGFYDGQDTMDRLMGMMLNASYTAKQSVFILSKKIVAAMARRDPNLNLVKPSEEAIESFLVCARQKFLEELYPPLKGAENQRSRSGLYRIKHPILRDLFDYKTLEKETVLIDLYEKSNKLCETDSESRLDMVNEDLFGTHLTERRFWAARRELYQKFISRGFSEDEAEDMVDDEIPLTGAIVASQIVDELEDEDDND